jgi:putative phage-type endonuclease
MSLTREQLALRRTGISASDLAIVCGLHPYASPVQVWEKKLGLYEEDLSQNPSVIRGNLLEQPILQWYGMLTERMVVPSGTRRHPKHELILATPDAISHKGGEDTRVVEVKCPGFAVSKTYGQPGTDEVPAYVLCQATAQMACCGIGQADVVMYDGQEPQIYTVKYDAVFFEALREKAERFWRDYVLTQTPPPPDATPEYGEFLQRYISPQDGLEPLDLRGDADAKVWLDRLKHARTMSDEAAGLEELAKNNLKAIMGAHTRAICNGATLNYKPQKPRRNVAWQAVAKEANTAQELIDKHTTQAAPIRPFRISWGK